MRHLFQPKVLNQASLAAVLTTLASYLQLSLWLKRPDSLVFLETAIFVSSITLWAFVFAWHPPYAQRPIFKFKIGWKAFAAATSLGAVVAAASRVFLDPALRAKLPDEYPADLQHWIASLLFSLAFAQLFLIFAPFDWCLRLCKNRWVATSLTALFGAVVLAMKVHSVGAPLSPGLLAALLAARVAGVFVAVWAYWRGGIFLAWWWMLLFELRHLPTLVAN